MPARWSFLPFVGASTGHGERDGEDTKEESEEDGDNQRFSHQQTAAEFARMDEEDIVLNFNAPISWWVSSSLFPLIAGTFGPMASAFNIMAVAINWRTTISPLSVEAEGTFITDPRWLVGVNAASLAIAIVANLTLLAQMGGQLRFNVASPITIVGWLISGFIDIGLVAAAPSCLPLPADQLSTYSQAYYYAVFAGALYIMLSTMLMVTAYGAWVGKHSSEFKLTMAQRSLMLQTMLFLGYVLAAGAVYARVEDWIYLDACYFIVVTLFTIGFGDLTPSTHLGRGLEFPMAAGGQSVQHSSSALCCRASC
jgi:potassium channel subfamily K